MQGKKGTLTDINLILKRLVKRENGCIEWVGAYGRWGYGVVGFNGRTCRVHKLLYEIKYGSVPKGLELGHTCENKCVNSEHVKPMTHKKNMLMGTNPCAIKARQTECVRGHSLSGDNLFISSRGRRVCKICRKKYQQQYRESHDRLLEIALRTGCL